MNGNSLGVLSAGSLAGAERSGGEPERSGRKRANSSNTFSQIAGTPHDFSLGAFEQILQLSLNPCIYSK